MENKESYKPTERFFVRRREDTKGIPAKEDDGINWEETFYLNFILHRLEYSVEVSVRKREEERGESKTVNSNSNSSSSAASPSKKLAVLKRSAHRVYANPHKIKMDSKEKAEQVELTYPNLYYSIANFDDAWKDIVLTRDGELVCVELFCSGDILSNGDQHRIRIFAGALDYMVLHREFKNKRGIFGSAKQSQMEFFSLQGPRGEGNAEMAICVANEGNDTNSTS